MFFSISTQTLTTDINILTQRLHKNGFHLALDQGWIYTKDFVYKGYCLNQSLKQKVEEKNFSPSPGNYTILDFSNGCIIHTDDSRSYPLAFNNNTVTNLHVQELQSVYLHGTVMYQDKQFIDVYDNKRKIRYKQQAQDLTFDATVDYVCEYLINACKHLKTDLPLYAPVTRGVDVALVSSAFDYVGRQYTTLHQMPAKQSKVSHWGYHQLRHNNQPQMLLTGYCGDEFLLRNPKYCQWLLQPYEIDLVAEFDKVQSSYMKKFFDKHYVHHLLAIQEQPMTKKAAGNRVLTMLENDYQMWHLDKVLTFTPFRNMQFAQSLVNADADTILKQVIHAEVSRSAIQKLNPKQLQAISEHKNIG